MSNIQCFKIKGNTDYYFEVKKYFQLLPRWDRVFEKVNELLGENITQLAFSKDNLVINYYELKREENKKIFKRDGYLKSNTKQAKTIHSKYLEIIEKVGLSGFMELREINFIYGVMRLRGQSLESFRTSENEIYYKADFDLEKKTNGKVEPITEVEYEEKYLEEIKKKTKAI